MQMEIEHLYVLMGMLILFQVKHWVIDFCLQTTDQIRRKGIYGDRVGIGHSIEHAIGTILILLFYIREYPVLLFVIAMVEGIIHYHIDWAKIKWGNPDNTTKQYWAHFGLDQMLHQITYILIVGGLLLL